MREIGGVRISWRLDCWILVGDMAGTKDLVLRYLVRDEERCLNCECNVKDDVE